MAETLVKKTKKPAKPVKLRKFTIPKKVFEVTLGYKGDATFAIVQTDEIMTPMQAVGVAEELLRKSVLTKVNELNKDNQQCLGVYAYKTPGYTVRLTRETDDDVLDW